MSQFENQFTGVCLITSSESHTCISYLVFLLQFLKPAAEDFVKRTLCKKLDPITRGNGLVTAVVFVAPLLCVLGKQNRSSASRCSAARTTGGSEAQGKAAAHWVSSDHSDCNSSPKWENNTKQLQAKMSLRLLKTCWLQLPELEEFPWQ